MSPAAAFAPLRVASIVLGAGGSTRMGRPKQTLDWCNGTLIQSVVQTALDTSCRPVVVVLGAALDEARCALTGLGVTIAENHQWRTGIGSSLQLGLRVAIALDPQLDAVVVMLADQPFVDTTAIAAMAECFARGSVDIVAAGYGGSRGAPAMFGRATFPDLIKLGPNQGAKQLIESGMYRVAVVEVADAAIDIDTPSDYAQRRPVKRADPEQ